jgi:hypothetical protein
MVSVIWSSTSGGSSVTSFNEGRSINGSTTDASTIYIRHDGVNPITDCRLYFVPKLTGYAGDFLASQDLGELLEAGDGSTANAFGGIQVNFDAIGSFSGGSTWDMSHTQKTASDALKYTVRTGVGDSISNGILIPSEASASMTTDGVIPAGVNAAFQIRIKVPTDEDTLGTRQFDMILKFTATT